MLPGNGAETLASNLRPKKLRPSQYQDPIQIIGLSNVEYTFSAPSDIEAAKNSFVMPSSITGRLIMKASILKPMVFHMLPIKTGIPPLFNPLLICHDIRDGAAEG